MYLCPLRHIKYDDIDKQIYEKKKGTKDDDEKWLREFWEENPGMSLAWGLRKERGVQEPEIEGPMILLGLKKSGNILALVGHEQRYVDYWNERGEDHMREQFEWAFHTDPIRYAALCESLLNEIECQDNELNVQSLEAILDIARDVALQRLNDASNEAQRRLLQVFPEQEKKITKEVQVPQDGDERHEAGDSQPKDNGHLFFGLPLKKAGKGRWSAGKDAFKSYVKDNKLLGNTWPNPFTKFLEENLEEFSMIDESDRKRFKHALNKLFSKMKKNKN